MTTVWFYVTAALAALACVVIVATRARSEWSMLFGIVATYAIGTFALLSFQAYGSGTPAYESACRNLSMSGSEERKILVENYKSWSVGSGSTAAFVPPSYFPSAAAKCLVKSPDGRVEDYTFVMEGMVGLFESREDAKKKDAELRNEFEKTKNAN